MITGIIKRNGRIEAFNQEKIVHAIFKAATACGGSDYDRAEELQDELQSLYTGGTVQHLYLGEAIEDISVCKRLIQKIFNKHKIPYISITPTFSICDSHGYISGEHFTCPECGAEAEVWSRVTGYLRPSRTIILGRKKSTPRERNS